MCPLALGPEQLPVDKQRLKQGRLEKRLALLQFKYRNNKTMLYIFVWITPNFNGKNFVQLF